MSFFGSLWDGVKSVGSGVASAATDVWNTGKDLVGAGHGYDKWDDVPWLERTLMNVGSGVEGVGKKLGGMVGLEDYMPSNFTDEKNRMKMQLEQQGHTGGWDWGTFGKGIPAYKIGDALFGDHPNLDENTGSSLEMGSGVTGGGEDAMKVHGGGMSGGTPSMGQSLGRELAIEEEPALADENHNENNFSF